MDLCGEEMTDYLWKYAQRLNKVDADGTIQLDIYPAKQQCIQFEYIQYWSTGGDNAGGTSKTSFYFTLDSSLRQDYIVRPHTHVFTHLPSSDSLYNWDVPKLEDFRLSAGDWLSLMRTFKNNGVEAIDYVEIRAKLNIYAKPLVVLSAGVVSLNLYHNEIIGVIDG